MRLKCTIATVALATVLSLGDRLGRKSAAAFLCARTAPPSQRN